MRRFGFLLLTMAMTLSLAAPALAAEEAIQAEGVAMYFRIDGKMHSQNLPYEYENNMFASYLIGNEHYVQLRHVALAMNYSTTPFDVQYNAETNSVEIIPGARYTADAAIPNFLASRDLYDSTARRSSNPILVNGVEHPATAYAIEGHNYLRLRDIANLAGFTVTWDQESGVVGLWSGASTEGIYRATVNGGSEDDKLKMQNALVQTTPNYLNAPPSCSLYDSGNGTVTVVDASFNSVWSDDYLNYGPVEVSVYDTSDFSRVSTMTLPEELPMYGAFLHGETYNYILYGQENPDEDDDLEVLRVVKYDNDWNRLGAVGVYGDRDENRMTTPFYSGGAAMVESGGELIVHAARINYTSYDGMRHQDSTTLGFNMDKYTQSKGAYGWGTSHSLGTDIIAGKNSYVTVDVSDGGRRALTFYRAGTEPFSYPDESEAAYLFPQPGTGIPGLTYGNAAATSTHYIAVVGERDKSTYTDKPLDVKYVVLNKDGSPSDVTGTLPGYAVSTCQPIVVGDRLMWYANLNNTRYFYTLPLSDL